MILRRVIAHFRKQEWTAIAIDFLIVVVGVFVGLQVNNWNEARAERHRLAATLAGLEAESMSNIDIIDAMTAKIGATIDKVEAGRQALNACSDDPRSRLAVGQAIGSLARDFAPTFIVATTRSLGSRDDLLDLLSPEFRKAYWNYQGRLFEEEAQLQTNFEIVWSHHISRYQGLDADLSQDVRTLFKDDAYLKLPPMAAVCADPDFRYRFVQTSGFIATISNRLAILREEVIKFRAALAEETTP